MASNNTSRAWIFTDSLPKVTVNTYHDKLLDALPLFTGLVFCFERYHRYGASRVRGLVNFKQPHTLDQLERLDLGDDMTFEPAVYPIRNAYMSIIRTGHYANKKDEIFDGPWTYGHFFGSDLLRRHPSADGDDDVSVAEASSEEEGNIRKRSREEDDEATEELAKKTTKKARHTPSTVYVAQLIEHTNATMPPMYKRIEVPHTKAFRRHCDAIAYLRKLMLTQIKEYLCRTYDITSEASNLYFKRRPDDCEDEVDPLIKELEGLSIVSNVMFNNEAIDEDFEMLRDVMNHDGVSLPLRYRYEWKVITTTLE